MDAQTLSAAMGGNAGQARYEQLVGPFNKAMRDADITTVNRAAMWCAQLGSESSGLLYSEEIADGSEYEGNLELGNTQPGDGPRFKGRGPIQLTGRSNYTGCSQWGFDQGILPTPTFFVDNPEAAGSDEYLFVGSVYYWTVRRSDLNQLSDNQDLAGATEAINGGDNGIEDRRARYQNCLTLGEALLPDDGDNDNEEEIDMATVENINFKLDLILDQLAGPGKDQDGNPTWAGWPQLGNKTPIDALADIRDRVQR